MARDKRYKVKVRFVLEYELDGIMADSPEEAKGWAEMTEIEFIAGSFQPTLHKVEVLGEATENLDFVE